MAGRFPVWGVLEPGAKSAGLRSVSGNIGVLATPGTIESGRYEEEILRVRPQARIYSRAAALLVPLAEEGYTEGPIVNAVLSEYLAPMRETNIDTLVLGCTHYPLLAPAIASWFQERNHPIQIVDSALATAEAVAAAASTPDAVAKGSLSVMVTDGGTRFRNIATRFLGTDPRIQEIDL